MPGKADNLDPVRWRGPTRGSLLRLAVVTMLLTTAAGALWIRPQSCAPPAPTSAAPPATTPATTEQTGSPPTGVPVGSVGVPIRLADPTALSVVEPGDRVDLLRVGEKVVPVAGDVLVLDVTGADDPVAGGLLLALSRDQAEQAVAGPAHAFAVLIRPH